MTQLESVKDTKYKIKTAKSGKDVATAIIAHFKECAKYYPERVKAPVEDALLDFYAPLFGLEK